jgi:hypothetical protein
MFCAAIQEFAFSLPLDNALLIADVKNGEPVDNVEILSLMAIAEALFVTVTIENRKLDRVDACHQLWSEAARLFGELHDPWTVVPELGEQSIMWLRGRLARYRSLCEDRCGLYSITEKERRAYAKCRETEMLEPEPSAQPLDYAERALISVTRAQERRIG